MSNYKHLNLTTDENDILWLEINVSGKSANVLSNDVVDEILDACDDVSEQNPKGLVIYSGKPSGFIAGADIKHFQEVENTEQALAFIKKGQAVAQKIEDLSVPSIAMIQGFCLGGGLELALGCTYRIASNNPKVKIGFPEVKLGIHPGFGGSVRAIQRAGILAAMNLILSGRNINGYQAKKMGLVDVCLPDRSLKKAAIHTLLQRKKPAKAAKYLQWLELPPLRPAIAWFLKRQVAKRVNPKHYPAPYAQIDVWQRHGSYQKSMYQAEADSVAKLIQTDTAQNLVRVFFLQDRLKSLGDKSLIKPKHVHVIGAGVMGADIAAWCVMQNLTVTLQDMSDDALANAVKRAKNHYSKRYTRDKLALQAALDRLIPDVTGNGVRQADVIIEAIFENKDAKQSVFKQVESQANKNAILATNTSSIPLNEIAEALKEPKRLVGLHFFNPVIKMPLLEVVFDELNDEDIRKQALAFGRHINKLPLPVKSAPGFLVNRILMPYLMEAVKCHQQGIPAQIIDQAATDYGMPMGPLQLSDTVGLDICLHVGKILAEAYGMNLPKSLDSMIQQGKLGKKSGRGFYQYKNNKAVTHEKPIWNGDTQILQKQLIDKLKEEAHKCLDEGIVDDADLLDAGMIFGAGFAPFRGGLKLG